MAIENISGLYCNRNITIGDEVETDSNQPDLKELEELWALLNKHGEALRLAEKENRFEDMLRLLDDLNDALPSDLSFNPFASSPLVQPLALFARLDLLFRKSTLHEKLGQMELALEDVDQVTQVLQTNNIPLDLDTYHNHSALRRGALLLTLGRGEEAIDTLRNHQPKDTATVLLYRFLEQKLHVSLLTNQLPTEKSAESLFMAGRYEEAERLLEGSSYQQLLRAASLTMLGRIEEAREVRKKEALDKYYLDEEFRPEYSMLLILHGDLPDPLPWNYDTWESFYHFPLKTYWNLFS